MNFIVSNWNFLFKHYFYTNSIHSSKKVSIKLTNKQKNHYKLTSFLEEIIVGCTLGDLTIERRRKSLTANSRLRFKESVINKEYLFHLF